MNTNYVIRNNQISDGFTTNDGLRQGGGLSPLLFIIFMDDLIKECSTRVKKVHVGYRKLQRVQIGECAFADDIALIAESRTELQNSLQIWNTVLRENGMRLNKNKTKVMTTKEENLKIIIEGVEIEQVQQFEYLGTIINNAGTEDAEINQRIEKAMRIFHSMNKKFISRKEITKETKMKIFKTIYRPILTYGAESWVLSERQKNKIQAAEMKYLRRVKGITLKDRIRSTQIREELKVKPMMEFIEQKQLSWWGHIQRMEEERPAKRIYETRIQNKRKRGRPRRTWEQAIGKIMEKKGKNWSEAKILAKDRDLWRKFVYRN